MNKQIIFLSNILLVTMLSASCRNSSNKNNAISKDNNIVYSEISDNDGSVYKTVTIGTQVWMAENLKTTKYNDGIAIPRVTERLSWVALKTPAYRWFNNDSSNKAVYGALYNWYTVNTNKLCPIGWHVPTVKEWKKLTTYLGGISVAGGKLKETGTTHWTTPNTGATNESGFTALPSALVYDAVGYVGFWWSSSEISATSAVSREMSYNRSNVDRHFSYKREGFSVRCLKD